MKYTIKDGTLTAVAGRVREKTETTGLITPEEMPGKVDEVFEAGEQSEWDQFWDEFQGNGERWRYSYGFAGPGWNDVTFRPKYNMNPSSTAAGMFYMSNISDLAGILKKYGCSLDLSQASGFTSLFQGAAVTVVPKIDVTGETSGSGNLFYSATKMETIELIKCTEKTSFLQWFFECYALKNIVIEGTIGANNLDLHWCALLTRESLLSVLNALKDYSADTSGTVWKVTLGETNLAKLTEEEIGIAEAKGWVLA